MSADPRALLLVATSGRALAESARRGGWRPRVIDAFGDRDTRRAAEQVAVVPLGAAGLHPEAVLAAADRLSRGSEATALVYGSGLEAQPEVLAELARGRTLLGNSPHVLRTVKDPRVFFALLDELAIAHPEVAFEAGAGGEGWLLKRAGGSGGGHVRRLGRAPRRLGPDGYLQHEEQGTPMSLLFIADGRRMRPIGFNTLWAAADVPGRPFVYGGAMNRARLSPGPRQAMCRAAGALTRALGLRGLNGLDFLHDGHRPLLLELNPRPAASFELHDPDAPHGLLALHAAACGGRLPAPLPRPARRVRALGIVYAPVALRIPAELVWPAWCRDLPVAGQTIAAGEPLCSVFAEAGDPRGAETRIRLRREALLQRFAPRRAIA